MPVVSRCRAKDIFQTSLSLSAFSEQGFHCGSYRGFSSTDKAIVTLFFNASGFCPIASW